MHDDGRSRGALREHPVLAVQQPRDNGNCTTAYGSSGNPSWVCDTAGSCVPGNCNTDADCTGANAGEICGLATPNFCGKCTTDSQCQSDPTYGPSTICDTTTGACVPATCTSAGATCNNPADFCCGAGGAIDCAGTGCSCVPGNCCQNSDCSANPSGGICGAGGPNVCGKCTLDSQCPAGDVCNTGTGQCQTNTADCSGTPGATGGQPGTCTVNAADMCCNAQPCIAGTGAEACCPGSAGNTYCAGLPGGTNNSVCNPNGYVCTTCPAVSGTTYIVNPTNGSDAQGTGNPGTPPVESCAFKTITRALQVIGTASAATTIEVVGGTTGPSAASGEVFPISIPANVTITTQPSSGPVTVTVPAGTSGFTMNAPSSAIQGNTGSSLTITSTANGATNGIVVGGTAGSTGTTSIADLTITGMGSSGILVNAGACQIGAGVLANDNGTTTSPGHGLEITAGEAFVVPNSTTATTFNGNTAHGILVEGSGNVTIVGSVTSASTGVGTVETNGNVLAGVWIENTVTVGHHSSSITGLVSFGNTGGNGLHVFAGSSVTVRSSAFLGNKGNGVLVSQGTGATATGSVDGIDLGDATTNGLNTFQAPLGSANNTGVGILPGRRERRHGADPPRRRQSVPSDELRDHGRDALPEQGDLRELRARLLHRGVRPRSPRTPPARRRASTGSTSRSARSDASPPPPDSGGGRVGGSRSLHPLDQHRDPLPSADARAADGVAPPRRASS